MKDAFFIFACVAVALAKPGDDHDNNKDELREVVKKEVREIIHDNANISIDGCVKICDAIFALMDDNDENATDIMCVSECQMQLAPSGNNDLSGNQLNNLIAAEVDAIVAVNPYFTVDHCVTACDALFNFFADDDEHKTDEQCRKACECKIDKNCDDHHGPGHHGPGHH